MVSEKLNGGENTNETPETGWDELAKIATGEVEPSSFDAMSAVCRKKIETVEYSMIGSSLGNSFDGFVKTCTEKTAEAVETATDRCLELVEQDDPEVSVMTKTRRADALGGRYPTVGHQAPGEFIFETLSTKCTPRNIGCLEQLMKTIPGTELSRLENVRMDAYRIEGKIIAGRSFIHDYAPEAHRLIKAMIEYYDAKDNPELAEKKREELANLLEELRSKYGGGYEDRHEDHIFDLDEYDEPAGEFKGDTVGVSKKNKEAVDDLYDGDRGEVKAIDVLRHLSKNMEPVPLTPPKTKIPELDAAFERLGQVSVDERTGELRITVKDLAEVVSVINKYLIENQSKRTLYPSTIAAIAYIDTLARSALKGMSKKEWEEMAFDPTFKEIVRFQQLTMSGEYNEEKFETTYGKFVHEASKAYGEDGVDEQQMAKAYEVIQWQVLSNAGAVSGALAREPKTAHLEKSVWSGNLTHELIGLREKYPKPMASGEGN